MTAKAPLICCLDLDCFFVSVERLLDPSLEGKPVIVGARPGERGVVTAASYEVRALGVHAGMPTVTAAKLAPDAIFLPTRQGTYGHYSSRVHELLERSAPAVQTASIDEYFVDFHGCEQLMRSERDGSADDTVLRVVSEICAAIADEIGLPASAGIATSKPVSKIASGLAKPRGVMLVPAGVEGDFLAPLPVAKYPGIGPTAQRKLAEIGVLTLGRLSALPVATLAGIFGSWAEGIKRGARGDGPHLLGRDRPAFKEHDPAGGVVGSISNERTFHADVGDRATIESTLAALCERVCWRARKRGVKARTVTLKLRYADFHTLSRSQTLAPSHSELELFPVVKELCERAYTRPLAVRLLGLALSNLGRYDEQLSLFACHENERLHGAVDAIRERFGFEALQLATSQRRRSGSGGEHESGSG